MHIVVFLLAIISRALSEDLCSLPMDPGPCKNYMLTWVWEADKRDCAEFWYGGCFGNENRFPTHEHCLQKCLYRQDASLSPTRCFQLRDPGVYCDDDKDKDGGNEYWFYNTELQQCVRFFYKGCGGNDNRFATVYQCRNTCAQPTRPIDVCEKCDARTTFCQQISPTNYTCECRVGFQRSVLGECIDLDECATRNSKCDPKALCLNTLGSYKCQCPEDYRGDGENCHYVGLGRSTLDCRLCAVAATCDKGVCKCKMGYQGDGYHCEDTNECAQTVKPCSKHATCENTIGSFICKCNEGYAGNGFKCTRTNRACLDKWDPAYNTECAHTDFRQRYYYDHAEKTCKMFWYDGCNGQSNNIFSDYDTCINMCETSHVLSRAEVCWEEFEPGYERSCGEGAFEERYYFDHDDLKCKMFWYDHCPGSSKNIFKDLFNCLWLCEAQPLYKSRACLQNFDSNYLNQCAGGQWARRWFFNTTSRRCEKFWFDHCKGVSENIFNHENTCIELCEIPAEEAKERGWEIDSEGLLERQKIKESQKNITVCNPNPCANGGTCEIRGSNAFYCYCRVGYSGKNCTIRNESPCKKRGSPCKNRGKCIETLGGSDYYCKCPQNEEGYLYVGPNCETALLAKEPKKKPNKAKTKQGKQKSTTKMNNPFARSTSRREKEQGKTTTGNRIDQFTTRADNERDSSSTTTRKHTTKGGRGARTPDPAKVPDSEEIQKDDSSDKIAKRRYVKPSFQNDMVTQGTGVAVVFSSYLWIVFALFQLF